MAEFLEVLETIRAEEASNARLFGGDGTGVRSRRNSPQYTARLAEAAKLVGDVMTGRQRPFRLMEAMSTSDFPQLFGDILDRQVLANYQETPTSWQNYCRRATVPDFRTVKRFRVDGGESYLEEVGQGAPYPESNVTDDEYSYAVVKYGRRMPFTWESMVNDDLQALKDIPERFGRAARRSEERFATTLFVDTNGPHASLYTGGNANIVTGNPALSIAGLQTAFQVLGAMLDSGGDPIAIDAVELVVPPALEVTAQNILNATEIWATTAGGASNQEIHTVNWMRSRLRLSVNPYIPIVAATADGNTSWYLFANPNSGRPALEMGFLRGHETPEIFMKSSNAQRVGGGMTDPMDGDFDTDSIDYKVRHVFGGSRIDPKMTVASEGDGA